MSKPDYSLRPHGLSREHERTLCHALGCHEEWVDLAMPAWEAIAEDIERFGGYRENVNYMGFLLPYLAEAVRIGIERGRRLERNPILDALYHINDE